jgi:hypothetical protein
VVFVNPRLFTKADNLEESIEEKIKNLEKYKFLSPIDYQINILIFISFWYLSST